MGGSKILVLGGTGPTGICLLRELLYRKHPVTVFARNPSKVPEELVSNCLLVVVKGELTDKEALAEAVSKTSMVISLLGPNTLRPFDPDTFARFYKTLFDLMRQHGVKRIFAMSTISYSQPNDEFSLIRWLIVISISVVAHWGWQTARAIGKVFDERADGLDWTVYRIAGIPGGCDEASWKGDREYGDVFEGWNGQTGWSASQRRASLARWLVDAAEDGKPQWIRKMPAISQLAGSKST